MRIGQQVKQRGLAVRLDVPGSIHPYSWKFFLDIYLIIVYI